MEHDGIVCGKEDIGVVVEGIFSRDRHRRDAASCL